MADYYFTFYTPEHDSLDYIYRIAIPDDQRPPALTDKDLVREIEDMITAHKIAWEDGEIDGEYDYIDEINVIMQEVADLVGGTLDIIHDTNILYDDRDWVTERKGD